MSSAYLLANGDAPRSSALEASSWACTLCLACTTSCRHGIDVAETLIATRQALFLDGGAPRQTPHQVSRFLSHRRKTQDAIRDLALHRHVDQRSETTLLIGCTYARALRSESKYIIDAVSTLLKSSVALSEACWGIPLRNAGALDEFRNHASVVVSDLERSKRIIVADPGCAQALRIHYPAMGLSLTSAVELVIELAFNEISRIPPLSGNISGVIRYHEPCSLGRGLMVPAGPRAFLERLTGKSVEAILEVDTRPTCSGAGGSLPVHHPSIAKEMAAKVIDEHGLSGVGTPVTACASSLRHFRRNGLRSAADLHRLLGLSLTSTPWTW